VVAGAPRCSALRKSDKSCAFLLVSGRPPSR
jgi:hypothetical protein